MTLTYHSPTQLDEYALRLLDIAASLRSIAQDARKNEIEEIPIHDKKALIWLENLEIWAKKSRITFELTQS